MYSKEAFPIKDADSRYSSRRMELDNVFTKTIPPFQSIHKNQMKEPSVVILKFGDEISRGI